MKLLLSLLVLSLTLLPFAGCETLIESGPENGNRVVRTIDTNGKEAADDMEKVLLLDRPSWLTDKPIFQY